MGQPRGTYYTAAFCMFRGTTDLNPPVHGTVIFRSIQHSLGYNNYTVVQLNSFYHWTL